MCGFFRIGAGVNDSGGCVVGNGPVHLVLHGLEKTEALFGGGVVVDAGGVNVCDLLVEAPLRCPGILDPAQQFIEVIKRMIGILQSLVIKHEALDD